MNGGQFLNVGPWQDPAIDLLGYPVRSDYVERFWLPILGPSVVFLLRRLDRLFEEEEPTVEGRYHVVDAAVLGHEIGLGGSALKTLARARRFDMARDVSVPAAQPGRPPFDCVEVCRVLPPLNRWQIARLPARLGEAHRHEAERGAKAVAALLAHVGHPQARP